MNRCSDPIVARDEAWGPSQLRKDESECVSPVGPSLRRPLFR